MSEIRNKLLTTNEACKMSTVANIFLLHTDKPKHLNTERKILQDEIKLRKRPTIASLYDKCVLILSPVGLRTFLSS